MKAAWYTKKWVIVLLHMAAWTFFISLPYLLRSPENDKPHEHKEPDNHNPVFYFFVLMSATWAASFYLNAYILIPRLIYKKKYWQFTMAHVATFVCTMIVKYFLSLLFFSSSNLSVRDVFFNLLIYLFIFGLSTAYQLIGDKVKSDKLAQE